MWIGLAAAGWGVAQATGDAVSGDIFTLAFLGISIIIGCYSSMKCNKEGSFRAMCDGLCIKAGFVASGVWPCAIVMLIVIF